LFGVIGFWRFVHFGDFSFRRFPLGRFFASAFVRFEDFSWRHHPDTSQSYRFAAFSKKVSILRNASTEKRLFGPTETELIKMMRKKI